MNKPSKKQKIIRGRRTKLIIGLLAIVIVVILGIVGARQKAVTDKAAHIQQMISSARMEAESSADKKVAEQITLLSQSNIIGAHIASSKVDVCYVTHRDQGWTYVSWHQDCYLRYVDGFEAKLDKKMAQNLISAIPASAAKFGSKFDGFDCSLTESRDYPHITSMFFVPAGLEKNNAECSLPNPLQAVGGSVDGPIILNKQLTTKAYRNFDVGSLNKSSNQLWLTTEEHYYSEELGCASIGCSNPRPKPIMAK